MAAFLTSFFSIKCVTKHLERSNIHFIRNTLSPSYPGFPSINGAVSFQAPLLVAMNAKCAECALLPVKVKYKRHRHPFHLIYSLIDYGSNEYYCDVCEERLYEKWTYYCDICEYTSHLACATSEAPPPRRQERKEEVKTDDVKEHNVQSNKV
ncbi:hypothetical protein Acr_29g0001010 [Actinidia rufa]|uniref:DC1 domain-containing protein n=1 Tax=Actinidia rufa TaxID=165716 RepID=A0A7J0HCZ4_9ERIC|nr:hypothetical protein Acr_29g0001010 [Actinidia rufa]